MQTCPLGRYTFTEGASVIGQCTSCKAGYYCQRDQTQPSKCDPGHYCPLGSQEPIPCEITRYNPSFSLSYRDECDSCKGGYQCTKEGISNLRISENYAFPYFCPAGKFCPEKTWAPYDCLAGSYSNYNDRIQFMEYCPQCPEHYYCEKG